MQYNIIDDNNQNNIQDITQYYNSLISKCFKNDLFNDEIVELYVFNKIQLFISQELISDDITNLNDDMKFYSDGKIKNCNSMNDNEYIIACNNAKVKFQIDKYFCKKYIHFIENFIEHKQLQNLLQLAINKYYEKDESITENEKISFNNHLKNIIFQDFNIDFDPI